MGLDSMRRCGNAGVMNLKLSRHFFGNRLIFRTTFNQSSPTSFGHIPNFDIRKRPICPIFRLLRQQAGELGGSKIWIVNPAPR